MIRGITDVVTANEIKVVRIHYSADPSKDPATPEGKIWRDRELQGYNGQSDFRWQKEMEINFKARGGQLLFPFLAEYEPTIRINPEAFPDTRKLTAGFDYGARNPTSLEITMWDETTGEPTTIWEYYTEPKKSSESDEEFRARKGYKVAAKEIKACPYFDQLQHSGGIAADPSLWALNQQTNTGLKSIADLFGQEGVHMFPAERGGDMAWFEYISSKWWMDPSKPGWKIWNTCPWLWQELQGIRFKTISVVTAKDQNPKDAIVDKDNHALDAVKYDFLQRLKTGFSKPSTFSHSHPQRIVDFVTGKTKVKPWEKRIAGNRYIPDGLVEMS